MALLVACCVFVALALIPLAGHSPAAPLPKPGSHPGGIGSTKGALHAAPGHQLASFSAGCFWGVEDAFRQVPGVVATAVGYTGGSVADPTYEQVCTHKTGHAETVLVEFDPKKVTYLRLLDWFWKIHDPTAVDRQGPDVGNNYRSAIWCYGQEELKQAMESKAKVQAQLHTPVATQVAIAKPFYLAEGYHQQYAERTGDHSCPVRYPGSGSGS